MHFILSCEHGGNEVPEAYIPVFSGKEILLQSHRGWDIGALEVANKISHTLQTALYYSTTSRLLVELNRSIPHPELFSEITRTLPEKVKQQILKEHYFPYRDQLEDAIRTKIKENKTVIHVSFHSFTPVMNGVVRNCDIGLLYDPKRKIEKEFVQEWKQAIFKIDKNVKVRFNYPYRGAADGFTTYLRKKFPKNYAGIELEINQAILQGQQKKSIVNTICKSLL